MFKPHIFFEDQLQHIEGIAGATPCAHVPFGVANTPSPALIRQAFKEHKQREQGKPPEKAA